MVQIDSRAGLAPGNLIQGDSEDLRQLDEIVVSGIGPAQLPLGDRGRGELHFGGQFRLGHAGGLPQLFDVIRHL